MSGLTPLGIDLGNQLRGRAGLVPATRPAPFAGFWRCGKRQRAAKIGCFIGAAVGVALLVLGVARLTSTAAGPVKQPVVPTGGKGTHTYQVGGFNALDIAGAIAANVSRSSTFAVVVTGPKSLVDHVQVSKTGPTLTVEHTGSNATGELVRVHVQLPDLRSLRLYNAASATLKGWRDAVSRVMQAENGSNLTGTLTASSLLLTASNAANISFEGSVRTLELTASDAVSADLEKLKAESAVIRMANGSDGSCTVTGTVTELMLSGGSELTLFGGARIDSQHVDTASVLRLR